MKQALIFILTIYCSVVYSQTDWAKSWYFRPLEFNCTCGESAEHVMNDELIRMLDIARHKAGIPFYISSGYRTEEHNHRVGGALHSSHVTGHGVDIRVTDDRSRWIILHALLYAGFQRVGIYEKHIHVDNSPNNRGFVVWVSCY